MSACDRYAAVVPWDILAMDCGQELDAGQVCEPRWGLYNFNPFDP
jgi:hypothetical protein